MSETCNHVAPAMVRMEAAVHTGLTNLSCVSSANEWLPCTKDIEPTKIKDLNFDRENFVQCGKKKRPFVVQRKISTR